VSGAESEEAELVRRAPGDPGAFADLYRRHSPAIQRYLRRRLGDPHLVEDAVAETFLEAWRGIARYEARGLPFRSWLYRLATSRAHRHWRKAARLGMKELRVEPATEEEAGGLRLEVARACLLKLAPRYQDVLVLHHVEGLTVEECAATLGCRPGTIKSRLARGREALRRRMEALEEGR